MRLRGRGAEVLRLLDIPPRPLVEREKNYIAAWDQMGFDDEALREMCIRDSHGTGRPVSGAGAAK